MKRKCVVCGRSMVKGSKYGVCHKTARCRTEYRRRWYADHHEEGREKCRRWRIENPDYQRPNPAKYREVYHRWLAENRERRKEQNRLSYTAKCERLGKPALKCDICGQSIYRNNRVGVCLRNPECQREYQRRRYAANLEANRKKSRESARRRYARLRAAATTAACADRPRS